MTEFTILMPCLNEAETLAACIRKARKSLDENGISGEILIADNGSNDGSVDIAIKEGARVAVAEQKGYGAALITGIREAKGKYVIMGDADDSYDFSKLMPFVEKLREGYDLVMGNRFAGKISQGAMPAVHRYFGNPLLSYVGRVFFKYPIGDFNSGLRGFKKDSIAALNLVTPGMEFAPEMVIKSTIHNYRITEVPITLHPDGRNRKPHLRTWTDGWRQLVFLLIYSPKWLFFVPSLILFLLALAGIIVLLPGTLYFDNLGLDIHTLTVSGGVAVMAYQLFIFALFVRIYSIRQGLFPARKKHQKFIRAFTLERGIGIGLVLFLSGLFLVSVLLYKWYKLNFGPINDFEQSFRILIPGLTLLSLGLQTIFSSFVLRILNMEPLKK